MSHDFLIYNGKLTPQKAQQELEKCTCYKLTSRSGHSMILTLDGPKEVSRVTTKSNKVQYFHGYADGVLYQVFNATHFDAGVSGSGGSMQVPAKLAKAKIAEACNYIKSAYPPHKQQALDLELFASNLKDAGYVTVAFG